MSSLVCYCTWILLASTAVVPSAGVQSIDISPRLRAADEFRLEVVHLRERSADAQNHTTTTPVSVHVVAVTPEGVTLDWTPGLTVFSNGDDPENQLLRAMSGVMSGVTLRLALTAEGKVADVLNRDEVASRLRAPTLAAIRDLLAPLAADDRPLFEEPTRQAFAPAALMAAAMREADLYFGMNGTSLKVGEPVEVEFDRPNPFGGDPLPATFRVEAESASGTVAVITTATSYDPEALQEVMRGRLEQQTGRAVSAEDDATLAKVEIRDDGRYLLDRETGLMRELVINRRVNGADTRLDRWTFRLTAAPRR